MHRHQVKRRFPVSEVRSFVLRMKVQVLKQTCWSYSIGHISGIHVDLKYVSRLWDVFSAVNRIFRGSDCEALTNLLDADADADPEHGFDRGRDGEIQIPKNWRLLEWELEKYSDD